LRISYIGSGGIKKPLALRQQSSVGKSRNSFISWKFI